MLGFYAVLSIDIFQPVMAREMVCDIPCTLLFYIIFSFQETK